MRLIVIGSAAGGSFPQWNCGCPNCAAVREGRPGYEARTQDAVVAFATGATYGALFNASPDVLEQIKRTRALWPTAPRHSPIGCVVLTNGDMDHVLGLFSLRESQPLAIYVTDAVRRGLEDNAMLRTLQRFEGHTVWRRLEVGQEVELADAGGASLGLRLRPVAAPGKVPVHFMGRAAPSSEDNVGLAVREREDGPSALYLTACATTEGIEQELCRHQALLFDGTFYREDELVRLGLSRAVARDMAHLPIEGAEGSLRRLGAVLGRAGCRRIYTHVNNTNPILGPTPERHEVERAGFEVAFDGMEIEL